MDTSLVKGEGFAVDASVMEAHASRYHGVAPEEADWSAPERQTRAVAEFSWGRRTMPIQRPQAAKGDLAKRPLLGVDRESK